MNIYTAKILSKKELILGEGALWNPLTSKFLYVDILGKVVGQIDSKEAFEREMQVDQCVSTVVPCENGQLIATLQNSIVSIDFEANTYHTLATLEQDKPENRCNDGKCDPAGRLWFGTMHVDAEPNQGALYCYDGQSICKKLDRISISNGICWSSDALSMYYIDSATHCIQVYNYDVKSGNISHPRTIVSIPQEEGVPDGMCIDDQGMLWVALWGGACVKCYHFLTGEVLAKVNVDAPLVSSCALGGKYGNQLFITTARVGMTEEDLERYPQSGSLFIAEVHAKSANIHLFRQLN